MSHPFDATVMFKSSGNVTKTGSGSAVKVRSAPFSGFAARIEVPTTPTVNDTILFRVLTSDNGTAYKVAAIDEGGAVTRTAGTARTIIIPFGTRKKYAMLDWVLAGTTGSKNFGAVKAGLVPHIDDWERTGIGTH